jgi:hypothetical protein
VLRFAEGLGGLKDHDDVIRITAGMIERMPHDLDHRRVILG